MENQDLDYRRIEEAIGYIRSHFKSQPNLEEIASAVHLSPFHFQKMFQEWAGISPKKFVQFLSLEYAKSLLTEPQLNLFDATYETGFSSTSRLHELFVKVEGMTPSEYRHGGKQLLIAYSCHFSHFGQVLIASTAKGICHVAFYTNENQAFTKLKQRFPNANFSQSEEGIHQEVLAVLNHSWNSEKRIHLHLHGTPFQLKVWDSLLKIPSGQLSTYGKIASHIDQPKASRAVGTAIGSNPIAFLIPCHRVIQASGKLGGYMWGEERKAAIIGWEAAKISRE